MYIKTYMSLLDTYFLILIVCECYCNIKNYGECFLRKITQTIVSYLPTKV